MVEKVTPINKKKCGSCGGTGNVECNFCGGGTNTGCADCFGSGFYPCPDCSGSDYARFAEETVDEVSAVQKLENVRQHCQTGIKISKQFTSACDQCGGRGLIADDTGRPSKSCPRCSSQYMLKNVYEIILDLIDRD